MKYFTLDEMIRSKTAEKLGIDNSCPKWVEQNLNQLVDNVLDPLRSWFGQAIYINSGYRCDELNKAVNGAKYSGHLYGYAADITANSKTNNKILFDYIKDNLPFDKLIDEKDLSWIHVSFRKGSNRYQILKENKGLYIYQ